MSIFLAHDGVFCWVYLPYIFVLPLCPFLQYLFTFKIMKHYPFFIYIFLKLSSKKKLHNKTRYYIFPIINWYNKTMTCIDIVLLTILSISAQQIIIEQMLSCLGHIASVPNLSFDLRGKKRNHGSKWTACPNIDLTNLSNVNVAFSNDTAPIVQKEGPQ